MGCPRATAPPKTLSFSDGDLELALGEQRDDREGFVDLEQIDLVDGPADLLEQLLNRVDGRRRKLVGLLAVCGRADDLRHGLELQEFACLVRCDQQRGRSIADAGRVAGRDRGGGLRQPEGRLEGPELRLVELRRSFVLGDERRLALDRHGDRHDLVAEYAVRDGLAGAGEASDREVVLRLAADPMGRGAKIAEDAHGFLSVNVPEPVVDHRVEELTVAQPVALARPGQEIRRTAHALHAAGDHEARIAESDRLVGQHDGLQAGPADLVDRRCAHLVGQPCRRWRPDAPGSGRAPPR